MTGAPGTQRVELVGGSCFTLAIPGLTIGAFVECTGLGLEIEVLEYNEGGNNEFVHKLPGRVKYPNIVLKRGITHEDALLKWVSATRTQAERKEVTITLNAADGSSVRAWSFDGAYPVKWTGPGLNPGSGEVATESLEIVHTGMRLA